MALRTPRTHSAALDREGAPVERRVFGARMVVELVNDGPVTIVLE
jgi:D-Tyr-tRNAtyr deacylase